MIIKKYPAPPIETAAERYDRDWLNAPELDTAGFDDRRHDRTLLQQGLERKSRRYVDDNISAVTGGSPVFDPNDGAGNPSDPAPTPFFVENFGPTLDSAWTIEGSYNPPGLSPKGTPDETLVTAVRNFTSNNFKIDVEFDFPTEIGDSDGSYFLPQIMLQSESTGSIAGLFVSVDPATLTRNVLLFDGTDEENHAEFTSNKVSFECGPSGLRITAGDKVLSSSAVYNPGDDAKLVVILQSDMGGSIKSISAYDLGSNGGGTPEPEEPEVPEGSYQEIFTEEY